MKNVLKYLCIAIATISITGCSSTATPSESAVADTTKPAITFSQKEGKDKENDKLNISSSVIAEEDKDGYIIDETINTDKEEKKETDSSIMTDTSSSKSVSSVNTTSDSVNQVKSSTGSSNSSNTKPGTGSASDSGSKPSSGTSNSGGASKPSTGNSGSGSIKPSTGESSSGSGSATKPSSGSGSSGSTGGSSSGANNNNGTTNKPSSSCTTVVVKDAWTETVVDKEAWVETVEDKPAWTEQVWVVDVPAHDEPIYEVKTHCNTCNRVMNTAEELFSHTLDDPNSPCFNSRYGDRPVQTGTKHVDVVGHYESIGHPAETYTVNHPAETKEVCG